MPLNHSRDLHPWLRAWGVKDRTGQLVKDELTPVVVVDDATLLGAPLLQPHGSGGGDSGAFGAAERSGFEFRAGRNGAYIHSAFSSANPWTFTLDGGETVQSTLMPNNRAAAEFSGFDGPDGPILSNITLGSRVGALPATPGMRIDDNFVFPFPGFLPSGHRIYAFSVSNNVSIKWFIAWQEPLAVTAGSAAGR